MSEIYDVIPLQKAVEKKLQELVALEKVDPNDVLQFQQDEKFALRFLSHSHGDLKVANNLVIECLQWRKQEGVALLNASSFPKEVLTKDGLYFHSVDNQGHRIFYMRIKDHVHIAEYQNILKRYVLWLLNREYWRDMSAQIVVLFDMSGAGLRNIDMDLVKFILACFQTNFPNFLAYLMVYELPLVLTAAWKIIQGWLSEAARKKLVFVKKRDIQNYISTDKLWSHMGGMDNFNYTGQEFLEESKSLTKSDSQISSDQDSLSNSLQFGSSKDLTQKIKSVSSNDLSDCGSPTSNKKKLLHRSVDDNPYVGRYLTVSPGEQVLFLSEVGDSKDQVDTTNCFSETVTLTNTYSKPVVFKVKTTSPNEYRIRPSGDIVECGTCREVTIQFRPANKTPTEKKNYSTNGSLDSSRIYDKLQILALPIAQGTSVRDALDSMRNASQEDLMQHRLICRHDPIVSSKQSLDRPATLEDINFMVQKMDERFSKLEDRLNELVMYQRFVIIFIVISVFLVLYF